MGIFYGRAKLCEDRYQHMRKIGNLTTGYLVAVFLHGFYDSCAMIGNAFSTLLFLVFIVIMYAVVFRLVKKEAASDRPV